MSGNVREEPFGTSEGDARRSLSTRDCEAIRKLTAVAMACAQARDSWPTATCDTPDRTWATDLERADDHTKSAAHHIALGIAAIAGEGRDRG